MAESKYHLLVKPGRGDKKIYNQPWWELIGFRYDFEFLYHIAWKYAWYLHAVTCKLEEIWIEFSFFRYKERLKTKYIKANKPTHFYEGKNWMFVKDGLDDFRDGLPPNTDDIVLKVKYSIMQGLGVESVNGNMILVDTYCVESV